MHQQQLSINGLREATQDELQTICDVIRAEEDSALAGTGFFDSLATVLDSWLLSSLRNFEIFSASGAVARLKAINADPVFSRFAAKPLLLEHLNSPPSYDWVHGLLNAEELAELQAMPQLRIATPLSVIGSQLIIQHTAESLNLPLICDSSFPHAAGLAEDIVSGRFSESFDGMALSAPPATRVLGKREFIPITYLPEVTHHLLGTSGEIDAGEYLIFTYGGPTTPLFLFRHLQQKRVLARQGTTMTSAEPHEVLQRFSTAPDKSRSLLFAPYSLVIASTLKLAHREIGSGSPADSACFLFIRSGRLSKRLRYLLEKALRHAWLELLERPQLRRNLLRQSFSEDNVARSFHRVCGLPFAA